MERKAVSPLVSIIIPVYNGEKYMREAIDSALAQTYENVEVIVVNDGSTDRTDEIAKSYGDEIRYFRKENGGVSSALNLGIEKMKGEYFSWLSHDDVYFPEKVEAEINYLRERKLSGKNTILFSDYQLIDARGKKISDIKASHAVLEEKPEYAFLRGLINGNSLLIPKKAFDDYGGFDTTLKATQDYEKWLEMEKTYNFVHVPKVLVKSRYHSGQVTNTSPKVRTEGNALWLKMIKSVSDKRKKELNGSVFNYYYQLIEFLKNTPYDEALTFCESELKKYPQEKVEVEKFSETTGEMFSKNPLVKTAQILRREGGKNLVRRVLKKVRG